MSPMAGRTEEGGAVRFAQGAVAAARTDYEAFVAAVGCGRLSAETGS